MFQNLSVYPVIHSQYAPASSTTKMHPTLLLAPPRAASLRLSLSMPRISVELNSQVRVVEDLLSRPWRGEQLPLCRRTAPRLARYSVSPPDAKRTENGRPLDGPAPVRRHGRRCDGVPRCAVEGMRAKREWRNEGDADRNLECGAPWSTISTDQWVQSSKRVSLYKEAVLSRG